MNNMTVVYADAEEKYVKNVILYGKTADNYLYTDSKCSEVNKVDKDTLLNLCKYPQTSDSRQTQRQHQRFE